MDLQDEFSDEEISNFRNSKKSVGDIVVNISFPTYIGTIIDTELIENAVSVKWYLVNIDDITKIVEGVLPKNNMEVLDEIFKLMDESTFSNNETDADPQDLISIEDVLNKKNPLGIVAKAKGIVVDTTGGGTAVILLVAFVLLVGNIKM